MFVAVHHLTGFKGEIQQVFPQRAGKGFPQDGEELFLFLRVHSGQRLVKPGGDFVAFIDKTAHNMGDAALFRANSAAQLADFLIIHNDETSCKNIKIQ